MKMFRKIYVSLEAFVILMNYRYEAFMKMIKEKECLPK